jgi:hypothetical protein
MIAGSDARADCLASQVTGLHSNDFLLWDHIKTLIYTLPFDSEEDLMLKQQHPSVQQPGIFGAQTSVCVVSLLAVY